MTKSIAELVPEYYRKREERLAADKVAQALASEEYVLKHQLIKAMQDAELSVCGTDGYQFTRREKQRINVDDWNLLDEYIVQSGKVAFLQRRISEAPIFEVLDSGILVPGVSIATYDDLSRPQKVR